MVIQPPEEETPEPPAETVPQNPIPTGSIATQVAPAEPILPPPPAPLHAPQATPIAEAAPAPIESKPLTPLADNTTVPPAPPSAPHGDVHVEEARRVPQPPPPPAPPAPLPVAPPATPLPSVNLSPSSTLGQRTLWAQIGSFDSTQHALAFWTNYHQTHPDFPVVRVRVTSPLAQQSHGIMQVNLRVGPFAQKEFIANLCHSLSEDATVHCGEITDLGIAISPFTPAEGTPNQSRYKR